MGEQRKKKASFCLKNGAKSIKVEFFDAEDWEDGPRGCVRVRVDGRWLDASDGSRQYFAEDGVSALIRDFLFSPGTLSRPPRPQVSEGLPVWVSCGPCDENGIPWGCRQERILSGDTVYGYDGRWYVVVSKPEGRRGLCAADDVRISEV